MDEKQFVDGINFFNPREGAPDFIVAEGKITRDELRKFMQQHTEKEIRFKVLRSRKGSLYAEVDTWKPDPNYRSARKVADTDDIPF